MSPIQKHQERTVYSALCSYNKCILEQIVLKYHLLAMWYFFLPSIFIVQVCEISATQPYVDELPGCLLNFNKVSILQSTRPGFSFFYNAEELCDGHDQMTHYWEEVLVTYLLKFYNNDLLFLQQQYEEHKIDLQAERIICYFY